MWSQVWKNLLEKPKALIINVCFKFSKVLLIIGLSIVLNQELIDSHLIILAVFFAFFIVFLTVLIFLQSENKSITTFKLPFSPFLQMIAVFVNVFLITTLSLDTFIRFAIWFGVGIVVYFSYGIRNSGENKKDNAQCRCMPCIERWKTNIYFITIFIWERFYIILKEMFFFNFFSSF